jgi:hypothetical protein
MIVADIVMKMMMTMMMVVLFDLFDKIESH